jgi:hypothetical protein
MSYDVKRQTTSNVKHTPNFEKQTKQVHFPVFPTNNITQSSKYKMKVWLILCSLMVVMLHDGIAAEVVTPVSACATSSGSNVKLIKFNAAKILTLPVDRAKSAFSRLLIAKQSSVLPQGKILNMRIINLLIVLKSTVKSVAIAVACVAAAKAAIS